MVQFGPYGPNHGTAGTFAFKREMLKDSLYDDTAALAEEKAFLKNYTVPFVQLEPKKTILVFSHVHNTFDKKTLLDNRHPKYVKDSDKTVDDFIKEPELKDFYMNQIEPLLVNYEPGRPEMKPDVIKEIARIKIEREKMQTEQNNKMHELINQLQSLIPNNPIEAMNLMQQNPQLFQHMKDNNQELLQKIIHNANLQKKNGGVLPKRLDNTNNNNEDSNKLIITQQQNKINELTIQNQEKDKEIAKLKIQLLNKESE